MGKRNKGRHIKKVGYLSIVANDSHGGKSRGKMGTKAVTGTDLCIFHAKKQIDKGFKNITEAEARCKEILGVEKCKLYNL
jgi:hypothetical protein